MLNDSKSIYGQISDDVIRRISVMGQVATVLANEGRGDAALAAVEFYQEALRDRTTNPRLFVETCGRALADIRHEIVAAQYGYDSPEADAEFDAGERMLSRLIRHLQNAGSLDGWFDIWKHKCTS